MTINPNTLKSRAKNKIRSFKRLYRSLDKLKPGKVDQLFRQTHNEVFECTDCLACANCCRTTGPLFTEKDIERISGHLKMNPGEFAESYLRRDEDDDWVLQQLPCPFLDQGSNMCGIYDVRPKACSEYPHTDARGQTKIRKLTLKNAEICPAVLEILEKVEKTINSD